MPDAVLEAKGREGLVVKLPVIVSDYLLRQPESADNVLPDETSTLVLSDGGQWLGLSPFG